MKRNWLLLTLTFVTVGTFAFLLLVQRQRTLNDEKATAIANWLRSQPLKSGKNVKVVLPAEYKRLAERGFIDLVVLHNGMVAYLIVTTEEWKGNYHGYVYVDPGFPFVLEKDFLGRNQIVIGGIGGGGGVIDEKISKNLYAVYSDLN